MSFFLGHTLKDNGIRNFFGGLVLSIKGLIGLNLFGGRELQDPLMIIMMNGYGLIGFGNMSYPCNTNMS